MMEFNIKKVGIIKDSSVKLDGLTIITGINNSGKSTVGKALYATLEAFNNMDIKKEEQIVSIFSRMYFNIQNILSLNDIAKFIDFDKVEPKYVDLMMDLSSGYVFMRKGFSQDKTIEEQFALLYEFLYFINEGFLLEVATRQEAETSRKFKNYISNFSIIIEKARKIANDGKEIFNDPENIKISKVFVNDLLYKEFKGQVFPINDDSEERISKLSMMQNGEKVFEFNYSDERGVTSQGKILKKILFENVFLIDDAYVLDKIVGYGNRSPYSYRKNDFDYSHNTHLLKSLTGSNNVSALEDFLNNQNYFETMEEIDSILPGELEEKDGIYYYKAKQTNKLLRVENLATGAKLFAIIKALLKKGKINYNTMLILDEPEAHLHPEWQNIMAQIIVMLVERLDINVLLTTHSINFVLALETYMHKYNIEDKTNFYRTVYDYKNNQVDYKCSNDEINKVYEDLSMPYDKMILKKSSFLED